MWDKLGTLATIYYSRIYPLDTRTKLRISPSVNHTMDKPLCRAIITSRIDSSLPFGERHSQSSTLSESLTRASIAGIFVGVACQTEGIYSLCGLPELQGDCPITLYSERRDSEVFL